MIKSISKSKLANIIVSFSWIFMIIVGTMFIMLAYNVIAKYKANENIKTDIELRQVLRDIFNNFGRTAGMEENTLAPLGNIFKDSKVEIICNDGIPLLSINGKLDSNNDFLNSYPTFMTFIKENKVENTFMAVESFRMPFKITNMLALVSSKNLIVIDKNTQIGKDLLDKFKKGSYSELKYIPADFNNFDSFNSLYVENKNLNSVMFVTNDNSNLNFDLSQFKLDEVYVLKINVINENIGNLTYIDKNGVNYMFEYYDYDNALSLPTMALFSRPETFNCSYNLLIDSISPVYDFYIEKSNYFANQASSICLNSISIENQGYYYDEFKNILINITDEVKNNKFKKGSIVNNLLDKLNAQHLILEDNNCQYIY